MSLNSYYISFTFSNNTYMLGLHFIYVTLFSSNIYMLVMYLLIVTQKTNECYSSPWHMLLKKSHNMRMFFKPGPMSSTRSEQWVWESGPKIDPATGVTSSSRPYQNFSQVVSFSNKFSRKLPLKILCQHFSTRLLHRPGPLAVIEYP